jgi:GT2 family glycosyltransferase
MTTTSGRNSHTLARGSLTSFSVIIATYGRADSLEACLEGVRAQRRQADEVIVVGHELDAPSARRVEQLMSDWSELRFAPVRAHGMVAAFNAGLAAARHSIVSYVDDDAVPTEDWLERIALTYEADPRIAAVGGRDVVHLGGPILEAGGRGAPRVGILQWFGRQIGNHHLGRGAARDVDILKGANMSFRREAVAEHGFDPRLRGHGAQLHSELSICLPLRRRGLRVVYDPAIVVDHYPAPRGYGVARGDASLAAIRDAAHNEALAVLDYGPVTRRITFTIWGALVGTRDCPGLLTLVERLATRRPRSWEAFAGAQTGRFAAWKTKLATPRPAISPAAGDPELVTHGHDAITGFVG